MEEQVTTPKVGEIPKRFSLFLSWLSLAGIFFAAAGVTWTYLANTSAEAATAAAAAAAIQKPKPPPLIDTSAFTNISLTAKSVVVVDETTGQELYTLHPDVQWPLASLTKVALVLSVGQIMSPESIVTIPFDTGYNSHTGALHKGDQWKLQDVIDFTVAASSNDGADILAQVANDPIHRAYPLSPPQNATLWRMNNVAQSLHLTHMYFLNDNGLDASATQSGAYGSARDVAALFSYAAITAPDLFSATKKSDFSITSQNGTHLRVLNTDDALPVLPNVVMGKTGYTDLAGGNLAVCFQFNSQMICAVVLGSTYDGRFADMKTLATATETALASK